MRITVNDIAHEMNIAQGTVSKALNGRPGISEELRAEVMKTASRLGYKVNRVAQSMSRAPVVIGVAFPNIWQGYYVSIYKGINNRISLLGDYNVHVVTSEISGVNSTDEIEKTLEGFIEQKVNGVVISRTISAAGCSFLTIDAICPARKQPRAKSPSCTASRSAPVPICSSSSSEMPEYSAL